MEEKFFLWKWCESNTDGNQGYQMADFGIPVIDYFVSDRNFSVKDQRFNSAYADGNYCYNGTFDCL